MTEPTQRIAIRFHALDELFDGLDPAPVTERDLDADAEEFVVGWVRELGYTRDVILEVHLSESQRGREPEKIIAPAVHRFFAYKADVTQRDLSNLFREARLALLIGFGFLIVCTGFRELLRTLVSQPHAQASVARLFDEGLLIVGWVALWKPLELFLYDWWPIRAKRRVYERLATIAVEVKYR